jgi:hypothetical protein
MRITHSGKCKARDGLHQSQRQSAALRDAKGRDGSFQQARLRSFELIHG